MKRNKATNRALKRPKLSGDAGGGRFGYFVTRAVMNIRQNMLVNTLTVGTITLGLLILSLFLLVYVNVEGLAENWSEKVQVTVYFESEPDPVTLRNLTSQVEALSGTANAKFVSKVEALNRFRERLKGQEALLDGLAPDILPASLEIRLKKGHRESAAVDAYVSRLKKIPGVAEVQYGEEWVRRFSTFMSFMRVTGLVLGAFLVLAVVLIVSNTIKLTIYARQDELEIMALVGGTKWFIKIPFLIEGIIQGSAGALLAELVLFGVYFAFLHNAGNFLSFNPADAGLSFLPLEWLAGLLAGGMLLGLLGSLTSLKRFVRI
ncbi:MAG: ABC transporter permease [Geobacter sp.]|nr:ABC transporter permease [Geobacter sp.]